MKSAVLRYWVELLVNSLLKTISTKAFFSIKYSFSNSKYAPENMKYYLQYKYFSSNTRYNNIIFTKEILFIMFNLLQLRVRRDSITVKISKLMYCNELNIRI